MVECPPGSQKVSHFLSILTPPHHWKHLSLAEVSTSICLKKKTAVVWLAQSRTDGEQRRGAESELSGAGGDSTKTQAERRVQEGFPSPLPTALRTRSPPGSPNHLCDLWHLTRQPPSAAGKLSLGKHSPPSSSQGCFQMLMLLSFYVFIYFIFIEKRYCEGVSYSVVSDSLQPPGL